MTNKFDEHDWHSTEYVDEWVTRSRNEDARRTPRFELMTEIIPYPNDANLRILDIGAGYGPVTKAVLEVFPNAFVVAHDYSEQMLGHAKDGLTHQGHRVGFHKSDLFSADWHHGCGGPFNAVVSSLAIHNLQSPSRIKQLYQEICDQIVDGGCFLNLDLISAPTPSLQKTYWTTMMRHRKMVREGEQKDNPRTDHAIDESAVEENWPPFPATLDQQLDWLREAGFQTVDCFWKEMGMALVAGFK
ncbi:class I SAM-dependent methyltransferase [Dehalococcoidia bacterium]|nr:class I SAM-dependent methyltransferase [Dehalococcoidia bacterium]